MYIYATHTTELVPYMFTIISIIILPRQSRHKSKHIDMVFVVCNFTKGSKRRNYPQNWGDAAAPHRLFLYLRVYERNPNNIGLLLVLSGMYTFCFLSRQLAGRFALGDAVLIRREAKVLCVVLPE